ncbi:hypothetical protein ACGCUP_00950 [Eubacteriales bacterium KG125]
MNKKFKAMLEELLDKLILESEEYGDTQLEENADLAYETKSKIIDLVKHELEIKGGNYIKIPKDSEPIDVALALWKAEGKKKSWTGEEVEDDIYSCKEIKRIGEHLVAMADITTGNYSYDSKKRRY